MVRIFSNGDRPATVTMALGISTGLERQSLENRSEHGSAGRRGPDSDECSGSTGIRLGGQAADEVRQKDRDRLFR